MDGDKIVCPPVRRVTDIRIGLGAEVRGSPLWNESPEPVAESESVHVNGSER